MTAKRRAIILSSTLLVAAAAAVLIGWPGSCRAQEDEHMAGALPTPDEIAQLPPDGGPEFNRLIFETSPYLLQHARNPVDWYPWGEEAFARALAEDKPVFLSVGYSTCHWCHVMERESFESDDIAQVLSEHYIAIKVDREERPDIDEIYMTATQLMTGRGGWPNSLWLTPDGRPWYAGTYFPPEDRFNQPGFRSILLQLAEAWRERRDVAEEQAGQLERAIAQASGSTMTGGELTRELVEAAIGELEIRFDRQRGGFSGAPKFPPHASLRLLLHEHARAPDEKLQGMISRTLDGMAHGGIHDQIGGGFHRYSTDAEWLVPHFEKMLYDNAMLARAYAEAFALTGDDYYREVATAVCEWALREMRDEGGGFYCALDADSEGVEGKFYLSTREQIVAVLGDEDGEWFAALHDVTAEGNYHEEATGQRTGESILHLTDPEGPDAEQRARAAALGARLRRVRDDRVWPHRDEKVLAAWNGLMIGALAYAGEALGEPRYTDAAALAAEFVLGQMRDDGKLLRTYGQGRAKLDAYLTDHAYLAAGLVDLRDATGDDRWLREAQALVEELLDRFEDPQAGGFFLTANDHEELLVRVKKPYDQATPSGNGIAAQVLVRLWQATGDEKYRQAAERTLTAFAGAMAQAPSATESLVLATAMLLDAQAGATQQTGDDEPADAEARIAPVTVRVYASRDTAARGDAVRLAVLLSIDEGWHINSHEPLEDYLRPTALTVEAEALNAGEISYPVGKQVTLPLSPDAMSVYEGEVWLVVPLTVGQQAEDGPARIKLTVAVQACNDTSCSAPQEIELELQVAVGADGGPRHEAVFRALELR